MSKARPEKTDKVYVNTYLAAETAEQLEEITSKTGLSRGAVIELATSFVAKTITGRAWPPRCEEMRKHLKELGDRRFSASIKTHIEGCSICRGALGDSKPGKVKRKPAPAIITKVPPKARKAATPPAGFMTPLD